MSIIINSSSRIAVQGAAGVEGQFHMSEMIKYGTKIVAGIDPAFQTDKVGDLDVPAYTTLKKAVEEHNADTSLIFVPAPFAYDAIMEALYCGIKKIIVITEGIPVNDMMQIKQYTKGSDVVIVGPNCPGLITPGECKAGILPGHIFKKGSIGVISRSGTLTYEIVQHLTEAGLGQSTCVGIGGDPVQGSTFVDILKQFNADDDTKAVVMLGEIGGVEEEKAADYIRDHFTKPVAAFIAGKSAPPGKTMGHAGAIISAGKGTAEAKISALKEAGVAVAVIPDDIADLIKSELNK